MKGSGQARTQIKSLRSGRTGIDQCDGRDVTHEFGNSGIVPVSEASEHHFHRFRTVASHQPSSGLSWMNTIWPTPIVVPASGQARYHWGNACHRSVLGREELRQLRADLKSFCVSFWPQKVILFPLVADSFS